MNSHVPGVFEALGHPTRREILEVLAEREMTAGDIGRSIAAHTRMSQPAVSQHLRVLRAADLVSVRVQGKNRIYTISSSGVDSAQEWLHRLVDSTDDFEQRLDALSTEIARGKRQRRPNDTSREGRSTPAAS